MKLSTRMKCSIASMLAALTLALAVSYAEPAPTDEEQSVQQAKQLLVDLKPYWQDVEAARLYDWNEAGRKILAIAAQPSGSTNSSVRFVAQRILGKARRYLPDRAAALRELYRRHPNAAMQELARADGLVAAAEHEPMQMSFTAVDGRKVDLAAMRGKVVLIHFWATWCSSCEDGYALIHAIYDKYQSQGFEAIGIACEDSAQDRERMLEKARRSGMTWPHFFDGNGMKNEYALRYGLDGVPAYFLIGRDGLLVADTHGGGRAGGGLSNLEAVVRQQLKLPPLQPRDESRVLGMH